MNDYTPTEEQMRYRASLVCHQGGCNIEDSEKRAEFDRFLAMVQAEAWDEGLWAGGSYHQDRRDFGDMILDVEPEAPTNPYRDEPGDE